MTCIQQCVENIYDSFLTFILPPLVLIEIVSPGFIIGLRYPTLFFDIILPNEGFPNFLLQGLID